MGILSTKVLSSGLAILALALALALTLAALVGLGAPVAATARAEDVAAAAEWHALSTNLSTVTLHGVVNSWVLGEDRELGPILSGAPELLAPRPGNTLALAVGKLTSALDRLGHGHRSASFAFSTDVARENWRSQVWHLSKEGVAVGYHCSRLGSTSAVNFLLSNTRSAQVSERSSVPAGVLPARLLCGLPIDYPLPPEDEEAWTRLGEGTYVMNQSPIRVAFGPAWLPRHIGMFADSDQARSREGRAIRETVLAYSSFEGVVLPGLVLEVSRDDKRRKHRASLILVTDVQAPSASMLRGLPPPVTVPKGTAVADTRSSRPATIASHDMPNLRPGWTFLREADVEGTGFLFSEVPTRARRSAAVAALGVVAQPQASSSEIWLGWRVGWIRLLALCFCVLTLLVVVVRTRRRVRASSGRTGHGARTWLIALPLALLLLACGSGNSDGSGLVGGDTARERDDLRSPDGWHATWDIGVLDGAEQRLEHTFRVANPFDHELRLGRVVPSCGCIAVLDFTEVAAPGEVVEVCVALDVSPLTQSVRYSVFALLEGSSGRALRFRILGHRSRDVQVSPSRVLFYQWTGDDDLALDVEVTGGMEGGKVGWELDPWCTVAKQGPRAEGTAQAAAAYRIKVHSGSAPSGLRRHVAWMTYTSENREVYRLSVLIEVAKLDDMCYWPALTATSGDDGGPVLHRVVVGGEDVPSPVVSRAGLLSLAARDVEGRTP